MDKILPFLIISFNLKKKYNKKYFIVSIVFLFSLTLFSQKITISIPDSNFEQVLIERGIDTIPNIDGRAAIRDISTVTSLYMPNRNISDLTGINSFLIYSH